MNIYKQFSRFATQYNQKNIIQKSIIQKYAPLLQNKSIIDLGCGSGSLLDFAKPKHYIGIDFSENMLKLHKHSNLYCLDFNQAKCWEFIKTQKFDMLVSFSALQWAKDLEYIFYQIKQLNKPFLLSIFTSNTFKTLHKTANITSPIYSKETILQHSKILNPKTELLKYKLYFDENIEMLRYIKKSGVSSGEKKLSPKEIKNLINNYPLNYLEFEIISLISQNPKK